MDKKNEKLIEVKKWYMKSPSGKWMSIEYEWKRGEVGVSVGKKWKMMAERERMKWLREKKKEKKSWIGKREENEKVISFRDIFVVWGSGSANNWVPQLLTNRYSILPFLSVILSLEPCVYCSHSWLPSFYYVVLSSLFVFEKQGKH